MKPRTKNQKEVDKLIHLVGLPSVKQEKWAEKEAFDAIAFSTTRTRWCSECGTVHLVSEVKEKKGHVVCPHCGRKLKVRESRIRTYENCEYYGIMTTCKGWQVFRLVLAFKNVKKGSNAEFNHFEISQWWQKPGYAPVIYERPLSGMGCWYRIHPFDLSKGLTLKKEARMRIGGVPIYTKKEIAEPFKKYGITKDFHDFVPVTVFKEVTMHSEAETLWKAGQYGLFKRFFCDGRDVKKYWPSIKICLRNGYEVNDADSWCDYIDALDALGLDLRNAHYVCPQNFAKAHEDIIDRKARKELADEMKSLSEKNVKYQERIRKFDEMNISDGKICLVVLPSIKEFKKEGDYLHHCVYKMKYYDKQSSLILSARIDGERIETIELSLKDYSVLQCHGNHNLPSAYHKEILSLVEKNVPVIRKFNNGKVRARA